MSEKMVRYTIREDERFGSGEFGCVYLARKEGEKEDKKKLYVIKIPIEDKIGKDKKLTFNNEVDILNILTPIQGNKYTSIIYDFKMFANLKIEEDKKEEDKKEEDKKEEDKKEENKKKENKKEEDKKEEIKQEDNKIKENTVEIQKLNEQNEVIETITSPFYVMDYFSKGLLLYYIASGELLNKPKLIKFIFKRIIISYKNLHSYGICHLDIKPDNIIFDRDFWPIIIDFGFSKKYEKEKGIKVCYGSKEYATPEAYKGKEVTGEKADIFSLGAVLFNLVTGTYGFDSSRRTDEKYRLIMKKSIEQYWKNKINIPNLPDDFKNLFIKMVSYNADERPSFDDILNDPYLAEVKDLSQKEEDELIKELNIMYFKIYGTIKDSNENEIDIDEKIKNEGLITRSIGNSGNGFFKDHNLKPKRISKNRLNLNKFIKINGNFSEVNFMNNLVNKINKELGNCEFGAFKNKLRFEVTFEYGEDESDKIEIKEEKEDEEKEQEKEKQEKEEKLEQENLEKVEESIGNCRMEIELFEYEKGKYLLEFLRTGGRAPSYNHHFSKIKEIIEKLYN